MKQLNFSNTTFRGWDNCCKISNDKIDMIIARDIGPRISYFALKDKSNMMYEEHSSDGYSNLEDFHLYGGHRLWHGPQVGTRPEEPDNSPIDLEQISDGVILKQATEKISNMEKKMIVHIDGTKVTIEHFLTNHNVWDIECTLWAITALAPGGMGILPFSNRDTHYLPNQALTLWPWTKMNDPRITYKDDYLLVNQDSNNKNWWKMGFSNDRGWMAYINNEQLFVKKFSMNINKTYSDYGASCESFTSEFFFELETVSSLIKIKPNQTVSLIESWNIYDAKDMLNDDYDKIVKNIDELCKQ